MDDNGQSICPDRLINTAMMGVARCQLRSGNIGQGIRMASQLDDQQLYDDCGDILEQQKQYSEAVKMFIKCKQYGALPSFTRSTSSSATRTAW